jgi:nucleoside-diphosphate-sugar epimerase
MKNEIIIGSDGVFGSAYLKNRRNPGDIGINRHQFLSLYDENLSEKRNIETIIHLINISEVSRVVYAAQHSDYRTNSFENRRDLLNVNSLYLTLFAKAAAELAIPLTYFSSGSVYYPKGTSLKETDPLNLEGNFYITSKIAAELLIKTLDVHEKSLIVRPFFMYGKNQKTSTLIPGLFHSIANKIEIKLNSQEGLAINPISSEQAANLVGQLHSQDASGIFNLAGIEETSIREVSLEIGRLINIEPRFVVDPGFNKISSLIGDTEKLNEITEQSSNFNLSRGLEDMSKFLKFT